VAAVGHGALSAQRTFLGRARALSTTTLAAGVAGTVAEVAVRSGDTVEEGAVLARLDTDLITPRLEAARAAARQVNAELKQARRARDRAAKLPHPVVTEAERERLDSQVEALEAALSARRAEAARLRAEKARHTVAAPFAGTVRARTIEPGMWVNPGQPLIELVSTDDLEVEVDVDPALLPHIGKDAKATLVGSTTIEATVKGVVPALDALTRTVRVRLAPASKAPWLLAGGAVDVRFTWQTEPGLVVDRDALVRGPSGVRVVEVVDGAAVPRPVKIVATAEQEAVVVGKGLTRDAQIITRGNERIRPGQKVAIVKPGDAPGGKPGASGPPKGGKPGAPAKK